MGRHGSAAAATATARGVVVILVGGPEEGRDGEIHLAGVGGSAGQVGDGKAGERGDRRGLAVSGGAAPASAAAAAIPVVTTTHDKSTPNQIRGGLLPPTAQYTRGRGGGCEKKKKRDNRSCLAFGSGRRIRTLTYRVRVCCATLTQSRYTRAALISAGVIIAKRWKMSRGK